MCNQINFCQEVNYSLKQYNFRRFINNKELNEYEIKMKKTLLESKPRMLMVVLTTRCNLECIMCSRKNSRIDSTLPFDTIKQVIDLFPYLEAIDWQGGEVFLVDYFKDLFLEASTYPNIDQSIITNGLLIDKEWAKVFANSRVNLTYSIDTVAKQTYEYIRKGARFEALLEGLEIISEVNKRYNNTIQLHINVVVMRSNYRELDLFPNFCQQYGIKHLRFDFLRPDIIPEEDILIKPDINAVKYLQTDLKNIERECKKLNIWFEYTFKSYLSALESDYIESNLETTNEMFKHNNMHPKLKCKLPWKKLYIDACGNGIVRPDCLCEQNAGSIIDDSIEKIWNNKIMQLYRQNLIDGNIQNWCSKTCLDNAVDTYQLEGYH